VSPRAHGDVLTEISDGLVALLKEYYGRGPTRVKSYVQDDLVVCLLRGGFSRVEQSLLDGGRGDAVIEQRMAFQDIMRDRFEAVIEQATGRRVIGFMSGNQQDPDIMCEVFILAGTDLVESHEIPEAARSPRDEGHAPPTAALRPATSEMTTPAAAATAAGQNASKLTESLLPPSADSSVGARSASSCSS
jgi:uncharacterized protein YbcI